MVNLGWCMPHHCGSDHRHHHQLPEPITMALVGSLSITLPPTPKHAPAAGPDTDPQKLPGGILVLEVSFKGEWRQAERLICFNTHYPPIPNCSACNSRAAWPCGSSMEKRAFSFSGAEGGFHPAFKEIPAGFPTPRRISIQIVNEPQLKIHAETYFAVTSNSVQLTPRPASCSK